MLGYNSSGGGDHLTERLSRLLLDNRIGSRLGFNTLFCKFGVQFLPEFALLRSTCPAIPEVDVGFVYETACFTGVAGDLDRPKQLATVLFSLHDHSLAPRFRQRYLSWARSLLDYSSKEVGAEFRTKLGSFRPAVQRCGGTLGCRLD